MKNIFKIIILVNILLSSMLNATKITITTGEWEPWVSEKFKKNGVAIDMITSILKSQGIESKVTFYPWKRAYNLAKKGKFNATAVWFKTKDRKRLFNFSNEIFSTQDVLIYKKGKKIKFNNFDDLKNYKIALTRGYSYGKDIDNMVKNKEIKVKWVNSDLLALKQIEKRDNFDIFICAKSVAKSLIADNFKDDFIFKFHPKPTVRNSLYFLVSKKSMNKTSIIESFNKGLQEFKTKGLIEKMINNSYKGDYK
jgi:polar amino acid transport system substrate-binding protein